MNEITGTSVQHFISEIILPYLLPFFILPLLGIVVSVAFCRARFSFHYGTLVIIQVALLTLSGFLHLGWIPSLKLTAPIGFKWAWLPEFGIYFDIGIDGLASTFLFFIQLAFLLITLFLGRWIPKEKVSLYFTALYLTIFSVNGTFLAQNLIVFYLFWELVLLPILMMVAIWGSKDYLSSAIKFFIYTFAGSMMMLAAFVTLAVFHYQQFGFRSFDFANLERAMVLTTHVSVFLMFGFFISFAIKAHVFPFHTWLPQLYEKSPLPVIFLVTGVLFNMGAYGFLRFFPAFFAWPMAHTPWGDFLAYLGAAGVVYGAWMALTQTDARRLLAYLSVSHIGYFVMAIFSKNGFALYGGLIQTCIHSLVAVGLLGIFVPMQLSSKDDFHAYQLSHWRGLAKKFRWLATFAFILSMAAVALPGTHGFVGEFAILFGSFQEKVGPTLIALAGVVLGALVILKLFQQIFWGVESQEYDVRFLEVSFSKRFLAATFLSVLLTIMIGISPTPWFVSGQSVLLQSATSLNLSKR